MQAKDLVEQEWSGAQERLDRVLVETGMVRSRHQAAQTISEGNVLINGTKTLKASAKVRPGQKVSLLEWQSDVGRGAKKLRHALKEFAIKAEGIYALDVGASTGGFTQVLLENGAKKVIALDVGKDQLASELRFDERVIVVEGCNARYLTVTKLRELTGKQELPSLLVTDVSFISVTQLFEAFKEVTEPGADLIVLVKPQFEVGREGVNDGVVRDPEKHIEVLRAVVGNACDNGFDVQAIIDSPIAGATGNREFLMHMVHDKIGLAHNWNDKIEILVRGGGTSNG